MQRHIINLVSKDTTTIAVNMLKTQVTALDNIFSSAGWDEAEE